MELSNRIKIAPEIARAILIKHVWSKQLAIEAFERNPNYIKDNFDINLEEADDRVLKFLDTSKVTCPVCYEEVDHKDAIIIQECGHHACLECMKEQCLTKLD